MPIPQDDIIIIIHGVYPRRGAHQPEAFFARVVVVVVVIVVIVIVEQLAPPSTAQPFI